MYKQRAEIKRKLMGATQSGGLFLRLPPGWDSAGALIYGKAI